MAIIAYGLDTINKGEWIGKTGSIFRWVPAHSPSNLAATGFSLSVAGTYRVTSAPVPPEWGLQRFTTPITYTQDGAQNDSTGTDCTFTVTAPAGNAYALSMYCMDIVYNTNSIITLLNDDDSQIITYDRNRYLGNSFWVRLVFRETAKIFMPKLNPSPKRNKINCIFVDPLGNGIGKSKGFYHNIF